MNGVLADHSADIVMFDVPPPYLDRERALANLGLTDQKPIEGETRAVVSAAQAVGFAYDRAKPLRRGRVVHVGPSPLAQQLQ
jgi:hypothetical protein